MYHPNFIYDYHSQYLEEPHPNYLYDYHSQYFEEPQESHNSNLETLMEDFIETTTHSRLESMMEHFVETQTLQNEEFRKQHLQTYETFRQMNTVVESLATHTEALETQISLLAQTPIGPSPERDVDVVTANSEEQIENLKESDNEVEESEESDKEKRVEIKKNSPTPLKTEVVEEVEKEAPYVVPPPYNPLILFPQSSVETKIDSQSKRYVKVLKNTPTDAPLSEVLHKKRKLDDHEIREIFSVKRGKLTFEVVDGRTKPKFENLVRRIEPEPPPQVQKNEPPHRRKKRKGEGYVRWLDKWPWKSKIIIRRAIDVKQSAAWEATHELLI